VGHVTAIAQPAPSHGRACFVSNQCRWLSPPWRSAAHHCHSHLMPSTLSYLIRTLSLLALTVLAFSRGSRPPHCHPHDMHQLLPPSTSPSIPCGSCSLHGSPSLRALPRPTSPMKVVWLCLLPWISFPHERVALPPRW
jgi:hypothetical protein